MSSIIQKKLIYILGTLLLTFLLVLSTPIFVHAQDRYGVYLERNRKDSSGVLNHLTTEDYLLAEKSFSSSKVPYKEYAVLDAFKSKSEVITRLDLVFKKSQDDDINYLVIDSHGSLNGIIDFSYRELRDILDKYKGHFIISIFACESGGSINKIKKNIFEDFRQPNEKSGEFENSRYNIFCSCHEDEYSYFNSYYAPFTKSFFEASEENDVGKLKGDLNDDGVVNSEEMLAYLTKNGTIRSETPVDQIAEPNLPIFTLNLPIFDFYGVGTWSGYDTHFAELKYNGDHTASLFSGVNMYGVQVHPYFSDVYSTIVAKDKNGNELFHKEYKGKDWVSKYKDTFSLPEGSQLIISHAEGTTGRFATSNNKVLKQFVSKKYFYILKDNKLLENEK